MPFSSSKGGSLDEKVELLIFGDFEVDCFKILPNGLSGKRGGEVFLILDEVMNEQL